MAHRHLVSNLLEINAPHQVHLPAVNLQNVETGAFIGVGELDLAVNPAGSQQRSVQDVDSVCCHQNLRSNAMCILRVMFHASLRAATVQHPGYRSCWLPSEPAQQCDDYVQGFVARQPKSYNSKDLFALR